MRTRLTVTTSEAAVLAAMQGAGLARVMSYRWARPNAPERSKWSWTISEPQPLPAHIVYAQRKLVPLKLRVFLDWTIPRLKARLSL